MEAYEVEIQGITALLHHRMTEEQLHCLIGIKDRIKKPKEARTPREIAESHAYKTDAGYAIPLEYIRSAFVQCASDYKQISSSRKSLKAVAGGSFMPLGQWGLLLDEKNKPLKKFEVDIRKATNHLKGAVAVCRPRFDRWRVKFSLELNENIISPETALQILEDAGRRVGIGSYRVSKGGYFGQYQVTSWKKTQVN